MEALWPAALNRETILAEMIEERRDFFLDVVLEAIEEIGLANAIREGRQNEFVGIDQISAILGAG